MRRALALLLLPAVLLCGMALPPPAAAAGYPVIDVAVLASHVWDEYSDTANWIKDLLYWYQLAMQWIQTAQKIFRDEGSFIRAVYTEVLGRAGRDALIYLQKEHAFAHQWALLFPDLLTLAGYLSGQPIPPSIRGLLFRTYGDVHAERLRQLEQTVEGLAFANQHASWNVQPLQWDQKRLAEASHTADSRAAEYEITNGYLSIIGSYRTYFDQSVLALVNARSTRLAHRLQKTMENERYLEAMLTGSWYPGSTGSLNYNDLLEGESRP